MKLLIKSLCIAFVLTVIYSVIPFQAECEQISEEVFRLHILANSDSAEDQALKLKVRDALLEYTDMLFDKAADSDEAENIARENLKTLQTVAQNVVYENGYDYKVNAQVVKMYFNTRYYDNYTMPAGIYDALRITVGDGKGHNWWCVMYPPLCIPAAEKVESDEQAAEDYFEAEELDIMKNPDKYEVRFKCVELFRGLKEKLSK